MTPSQEELRAEYRLQLATEERKFDAMIAVVRLVQVNKTNDSLNAAMAAEGFNKVEAKEAYAEILRRTAQKKASND
jgi:hypothetical protein